ncbi:hypothetical protein [Streptomyces sp. MAI_2237]
MHEGCLVAGQPDHGVRDMLALQAKGLVSSDLDADRTAAALLAGIQGGVTMMMSTGDSTHLKAALDTGLDYLRARATDAGDA